MASELTAARQEMRKASYKFDVVQCQMRVMQKQLIGMQDQMNRWETLLQGIVNSQRRTTEPALGSCTPNLRQAEEPREMELEMARSVEDPRQINLNSTQGFRLNGTPEGNSNSPSTGYSVVPSGWGQNQLPPACLVSPKLNNLNPSHSPELARQCPQLNVTGVVEIPEGNGSGVVWDDSGHIVTNYHVVGNALSKNPKPGEVVARVSILAVEGIQKNFDGKLVGADRAKDLAVLMVDAPTDLLKPINVGLSSALRVGQQCLAIGNPFGFDHTLTVGVISGLNQDIFSKAGVTIEDGAHFHMKQGAFLYNLEAQTLPKSHNGYFIMLTLEYFKFSSLDSYEFSACKFNNPKHRHYVILSKSIIVASVVMNSTVSSSKEPGSIVFHILTETQNFYAMKLWFVRNIHKKAYVHVINYGAILMRQLAEFNPLQFNAVYCYEGYTGYAVVSYTQDWNETNQHGKYIYGWLAKEEDYKSGDPVGRFLSQKGDLKTVADLEHDLFRKTDNLITSLTN